MFPVRAGLITLLFLASASCGDDAQPPLGAELILPFKTQLKAALQKGLQSGAVEAINVCKDQAPAIAEGLSAEGVRMGRTSHRLRNPDNVAPAWAEDILTSYLDAKTDWKPQTLQLSERRKAYAEPIVMQPLCLACHGETLAPDVASEIQRLYPEDQATGFEPGELRGVYWVEYPASLELPGKHTTDGAIVRY